MTFSFSGVAGSSSEPPNWRTMAPYCNNIQTGVAPVEVERLLHQFAVRVALGQHLGNVRTISSQVSGKSASGIQPGLRRTVALFT